LLRKMRLRCRDGKLQQNRNGNMSISHQRSVILNGMEPSAFRAQSASPLWPQRGGVR
jgi:hypothetical protein